jgi:hypothetical protein
MQLTHSLKAPGFNPRAYKVRNRFQAFTFKCNLHRYTEVGDGGDGDDGKKKKDKKAKRAKSPSSSSSSSDDEEEEDFGNARFERDSDSDVDPDDELPPELAKILVGAVQVEISCDP